MVYEFTDPNKGFAYWSVVFIDLDWLQTKDCLSEHFASDR